MSGQSNRKNGFQKDNATFTGLQNFFLSCFFMIQACAIGLRSVSIVGQVRNMSTQPDQIIRFSYNLLVQRYFG